MIGRIRGNLIEKQPPQLLIDVMGVGYELQSPMTTFYHLPAINNEVVLHTHFSVSENNQQLFGFISQKDRDLFRLLIKINGVGPKMAVSILSIESSEFIRYVMDENVTALVKLPGVGKKTAERLVVEMRDKLKSWSGEVALSSAPIFNELSPLANDPAEEAESALVALGYKQNDASRVVSKLSKDKNLTTSEDLIRASLKSMMPG